jgi:ribonuclease T2
MARVPPILPQAKVLPAFTRRLACAAIIGAALSAPGPSAAQDRRQGEPGQFDYYVLVLSWSPSFCANSADRNPAGAARNPQCGRRPFSFVVHGLWPQYERGFPEYCQVPAPRLSRDIVSTMLDLMPAPALIFHEWDRHGVCSGLSPGAYFETIRKAREQVKIPPQYVDLPSPLTVTPQEVEEAFITANPSLKAEGISVSCGGRRLDEVKICMTRDLQFRGCEEIARRTCRRDRLIMPPVRGG